MDNVKVLKVKKVATEIRKTKKKNNFGIIGKIIGIVGALILFIIYIRSLLGIELTINFNDFLQFLIRLSNIQLNIPFLQILEISGDWGIIDGLRIFINSLSAILSILLYIAEMLINVAITIGYIISTLFTA